MGKDSIGLITFATGKYIRYVQGFIETAWLFFCPRHPLTIYVFSNIDVSFPLATRVPCKHEPWPLSTLKRYHNLLSDRGIFTQSLLFMLDVDLLFSGPITEEIFPPRKLGITAVHHPGFFKVRVPPWDTQLMGGLPKGHPYCAGGFVGGWSESFWELVTFVVERSNQDIAEGKMALWHDESYLNKFVFDHGAHLLPPSYCFDHGFRQWGAFDPSMEDMSREAKVTLLHKNHQGMREE